MKSNKILKVLLIAVVFVFGSCESIDLDQTENPSAANPQLLDPTFAFNYVQLSLPDFVYATNGFAQEVVRQMAMTGGNTYDNAFAPVNFNSQWSTGYNILNAIKILEPKAQEKNQTYILGASKVIRCYVLMTFVDMYGNIPYSQSLLGVDNITPSFDDDETVYASIINELDQSIALLRQNPTTSQTVEDLYYTSKESWITLANTLKLKMYNNCNLLTTVGGKNVAAEINAIVAQDNIIDTKAEDFAFRYGNTRFNPNSRHPLYNDQYEQGGGAYIGNYFMWAMTTEKGISGSSVATQLPPYPLTNTDTDFADPRVYYYFYRQDTNPNDDDTFTLPGKVSTRPEHYNNARYSSFYSSGIRACFTISNWIAGPLAGGFWGRDHGNNSGIPPDQEKRTCAGLYPIGGEYGGGTTVQNNGQAGMKGAGIMPIMLSSWVHFIKSELMLKGIIAGNAKDELLEGISQSINKSTTLFPEYDKGLSATVLTTKTSQYLDFIGLVYDNADDARKLELVIKEYYIATWGNGIEPYNNYRRTGYPSNMQPTLEPESGAFYNAAWYAGNCINNNPNVPTNDRTRKVFWAEPNTASLN